MEGGEILVYGCLPSGLYKVACSHTIADDAIPETVTLLISASVVVQHVYRLGYSKGVAHDYTYLAGLLSLSSIRIDQ